MAVAVRRGPDWGGQVRRVVRHVPVRGFSPRFPRWRRLAGWHRRLLCSHVFGVLAEVLGQHLHALYQIWSRGLLGRAPPTHGRSGAVGLQGEAGAKPADVVSGQAPYLVHAAAPPPREEAFHGSAAVVEDGTNRGPQDDDQGEEEDGEDSKHAGLAFRAFDFVPQESPKGDDSPEQAETGWKYKTLTFYYFLFAFKLC